MSQLQLFEASQAANRYSAALQHRQGDKQDNSCTPPTTSFRQVHGPRQGSSRQLFSLDVYTCQLACFPGQPIQVKLIFFLHPDKAETRPPLDMANWYSPLASLLIVTGNLLLTTINLCSFFGGVGAGVSSPLDCSGTPGSFEVLFLGETGLDW
jgi:hypothetical protein